MCFSFFSFWFSFWKHCNILVGDFWHFALKTCIWNAKHAVENGFDFLLCAFLMHNIDWFFVSVYCVILTLIMCLNGRDCKFLDELKEKWILCSVQIAHCAKWEWWISTKNWKRNSIFSGDSIGMKMIKKVFKGLFFFFVWTKSWILWKSKKYIFFVCVKNKIWRIFFSYKEDGLTFEHLEGC